MQLSDNISLLLPKYQNPYSVNLPIEKHDTFFFDLKNHMNENVDYRKNRIEYAKTKPKSWSLFRIKDEYFHAFLEEKYSIFENDLNMFVRKYPDMELSEALDSFCSKYRGYLHTYGKEIISRALEREYLKSKITE
jgi:hypothetical protein